MQIVFSFDLGPEKNWKRLGKFTDWLILIPLLASALIVQILFFWAYSAFLKAIFFP